MPGKVYTGIQMTIPNSDKMLIPARSLREDSACEPSLRQWLLCVCSDKVQALCYLQLTRQLVSCSSDGGIAVWNMDVSREEVRESEAGLTWGGPTTRLLVFHPLAGDAGSPSPSPLCLLVIVQWGRACQSLCPPLTGEFPQGHAVHTWGI